MDKITREIFLKGEDWERIIDQLYRTVFPTLYDMYVLCASIGIMYDKQLSMNNIKDADASGMVPRTIQQNNAEELDILFQTAILTTDCVDFDEDTRLELAFGDTNRVEEFDKIHFLTRYANYGAKVLAEQLGDEVLESMENIKELLIRTLSGLNFDIDPVDIEALDISVDDLLDD